ncbi:hypothetical protein [Streptomyces cyaneus]|uniref:hypothetical protein n=1 Tax=Streptomyces cyaneus TaxID=1904 RepID=UPI000FF8A4DE
MNRFVAAERAPRSAPPHRLVAAVREALCNDYAATTVQLYWAELAELTDLAGALGHEVILADRDTDPYLQARRTDRLTFALGRQPEPACATFAGNLDRSATADHLMLHTANGVGEAAVGPRHRVHRRTARGRRPPCRPERTVRSPGTPVADDDALVVFLDRFGPRRTP